VWVLVATELGGRKTLTKNGGALKGQETAGSVGTHGNKHLKVPLIRGKENWKRELQKNGKRRVRPKSEGKSVATRDTSTKLKVSSIIKRSEKMI